MDALELNICSYIFNEFNRLSLREYVDINSEYRGVWRTDKGDVTHNILEGK